MKSWKEWFGLKPKLDIKKDVPFFRVRELWWTHLGENVGHEQDGHGDKSLRPVLVVVKFSKHLFFGIPQTSQRKDDAPFYYSYQHDGGTYTLLLSQMRVFSSKRLHERLGKMAPEDFVQVKKHMQDWFT